MAIKLSMLLVFFGVMVGIGLYCRKNATDGTKAFAEEFRHCGAVQVLGHNAGPAAQHHPGQQRTPNGVADYHSSLCKIDKFRDLFHLRLTFPLLCVTLQRYKAPKQRRSYYKNKVYRLDGYNLGRIIVVPIQLIAAVLHCGKIRIPQKFQPPHYAGVNALVGVQVL